MESKLTKEMFENKYVKSFMDHIGIDLPYVLDTNNRLVARIYPNSSYFGKLNVHFEGAVFLNSNGLVHGLLIIYVHGRPLRNQAGCPVISCTVDANGNWTDCNLSIDEFDEYEEPQKEPSKTFNKQEPHKKMTFKELLDFTFNTHFTLNSRDQNQLTTCLAKGLEFYAHVKKIDSADTSERIKIEFELLGQNMLVGWSDVLLFERTKNNKLTYHENI